jgi:hypothetical protein
MLLLLLTRLNVFIIGFLLCAFFSLLVVVELSSKKLEVKLDLAAVAMWHDGDIMYNIMAWQ